MDKKTLMAAIVVVVIIAGWIVKAREFDRKTFQNNPRAFEIATALLGSSNKLVIDEAKILNKYFRITYEASSDLCDGKNSSDCISGLVEIIETKLCDLPSEKIQGMLGVNVFVKYEQGGNRGYLFDRNFRFSSLECKNHITKVST